MGGSQEKDDGNNNSLLRNNSAVLKYLGIFYKYKQTRNLLSHEHEGKSQVVARLIYAA